MTRVFGVLLGIVWTFAGPVTYILAVVDTWHTNSSVIWKLFLNLTLDAAVAFFWPVTWIMWGIQHSQGVRTPLRLVFG